MYNYFNSFQNAPYQTLTARQEIIRVCGENGARAYQMAPNSSVLLLDENNPVIYLKQSDGAGYSTLTSYKISPCEPEKQINTNDLEKRISRLEELIYESDIINAKQTDPKQRNESTESDQKRAERKQSR